MNTSIQDAFNLAWKIAYVLRGNARPELLDTYNVERHPVAESLLSGTDQAYTRLINMGDLAKYAVGLLGPTLLASETVRNAMRDTLEEVNINYRKGPLTLDFSGSDGPEAGDRALDATVVEHASRESKPLREFLRGGHWTLLAFSGRHPDEAAEAELTELLKRFQTRYPATLKCYLIAGGFPVRPSQPAVLLDATLQAHEQYGVRHPCLYLIRPDWYISFRGKPEHSAALQSLLDRFLLQNVEVSSAG